MAKYSRTSILVFFTSLAVVPANAQSEEKEPVTNPVLFPDCPPQLANRGDTQPFSTEPFNCHCSAEARRLRGGYAYGSGPYDGISNICMAALHAGATGKEGGDVRVIPGPVQESFVGTLANGVFSSDWDHPSQFGSFDVERFVGH
ncbi:LCCL domain-containing protein [Ruegeria sp. HKCCD7318]|uniref:LCCL domain-containing protein n=1 Tax=Ruegeria sp. HKCCD7318 TaxID=2683014 RepID=UPI0014924639|nr:LCCL domain-containing protein [Ruegeria sp. HKCCD7318]NOE32310.1 hypothetical protein [Ruegeria sp. HKCCD7318]